MRALGFRVLGLRVLGVGLNPARSTPPALPDRGNSSPEPLGGLRLPGGSLLLLMHSRDTDVRCSGSQYGGVYTLQFQGSGV